MAAASESLSWVCEAQLGSGGFGIVHVWRNAATGRKVALKKCKFGSDVTMTARHKAQWCQEVRHFWCRKFLFLIDNFLCVAGILQFLRIPVLALSIQWRPRFFSIHVHCSVLEWSPIRVLTVAQVLMGTGVANLA